MGERPFIVDARNGPPARKYPWMEELGLVRAYGWWLYVWGQFDGDDETRTMHNAFSYFEKPWHWEGQLKDFIETEDGKLWREGPLVKLIIPE